MNKSLSATMALIALVLPSMPAYAGPILDELVGPSFASWTASDENIKPDGSEIYTNLSLEGENETITFDSIMLQRTDDLLAIDFEGLDSTTTDNEAMQVSRGSLSGDMRLFATGLSVIDNLVEDKIETCDELDLPFRLQVHDVVLYEPDGTSSGENSGATLNRESIALGIDQIRIDYSVNTDEDDCIMDMDMTAKGLTMNDGSELAISIAELSGTAWWSLLNEKALQNLSKSYTARFDVIDTDVMIGGMSELHIDRISSNNTLDPASMKALVDSGYFTVYHDIISLSESDTALDFSDISVPTFWNATADLVSNGDFNISGLEITGDLASSAMNTMIFKRGHKLDLSMDYVQNTADVSTNLSIKSDGLFDVELNTDFVMDDMDMALGKLGPEALMIATPVSLRLLSIKLMDDKFGDILGKQYQIDPYMMVEPFLMTWLGPEDAGMVSKWLGQARTGGTTLVAAPDRPVPVMQIFEGIMSDWSALGKLLNIRTEK